MADFSSLNGYNVKDAQARADIETLNKKGNYKRKLTSADNLNNLFEDGRYIYNSDSVPANAPFPQGCVVEVIGANSNVGTKHIVTRYGIAGESKTRVHNGSSWLEWTTEDLLFEDATYKGCYYRMVDGVKQWENPPLVTGEEYATTRRYKGKVVYVKHIDLGTLPASDTKSTYYINSGKGGNVIDSSIILKNNGKNYIVPLVVTSGEVRSTVYFTEWSIIVSAITNSSAYTGECTVWYTKI